MVSLCRDTVVDVLRYVIPRVELRGQERGGRYLVLRMAGSHRDVSTLSSTVLE